MPGKTSFYYAIFKKLQAVGRALNVHVNKENDPNGNFGGFSLRSADSVHGIFGGLGTNASEVNLPVGSKPLVAGNFVPSQNPLYAILKKSLTPTPPLLPDFIPVAGKQWPVMPFPLNGVISNAQIWFDFNGGPGGDKLVKAIEHWIAVDHKASDIPTPAPLTFAALGATGVTKFAYKPADVPAAPIILFVASMPGDDGRRHGDGETPDPALDHVPVDFWDKAQIFVTNEGGEIQDAGAPLVGGTERYITAIIGNASVNGAGRLFQGLPTFEVRCDAQVFGTFTSPSVPLPSLGNLDPADPNPIYEQFSLAGLTYDLAGFRFNVDAVFNGFTQAMAGFTTQQLGGTLDQWLKAGHACVKVRITQGEQPNNYTPVGAVPTLQSNPRKDRHIAQRNIGQFDAGVKAAKKAQWKNFIMSQAGKGTNMLSLASGLPADAVRFYLAVPTQTFERYFAKGGSYRGFEQVKAPSSKPFPDAVILHATSAEAHLVVADHAKEPFLALSFGIEIDPARLKDKRVGSVSVSHAGPGGEVVGGFTLRPAPER